MTQPVSPPVSQSINQGSNESMEILNNDDVDGGQSVFQSMDLLQSRTMNQWCFIQRNTSQRGPKKSDEGYDIKKTVRKIK